MADNQVQGQNGSVFISYSRKDKEFVRKLHNGLMSQDVKTWVDWEGIPLSADWMEEITSAVNSADAFLVVISPDWLASKVCADELELGLASKKKLVPILYRAPEKGTPMHEKLAATNWVYMRPEDDFEATLPKLVEAIGTDLDWVRQHTRLLNRANEWDHKNRNASFLLQGADLDDGEKWMGDAAQNAKREVLPLQAEYISTSRKEAVRRQRMLLVGVSLALVVSVVLGIFALFQRNAAVTNEALAIANAATAVANENARATQQVLAETNEKLAKENETLAKKNEVLALSQRNAAEAKLYQGKAGQLDVSTLLAIDSWQRSPSFQAEEILRQNLTWLPKPIFQMDQGDYISDLIFSPNGQEFVSPGKDGKACVWVLQTGQAHFCAQHEKQVYDAAFSADGQLLATSSEDGSVRLWKLSDGSPAGRYDFGGPAWSVRFSPNGEWLLIGLDGQVRALNLVNSKIKPIEVKVPGSAYELAFAPDSKWAGIGTSTGNIMLWSVGSHYINAGPVHSDQVLALDFSPDGQTLLSAGADSIARLTKTVSGKELMVFHAGDWVEDASFSPDGSWVVAASDDKRVWLWDVKTGLPKRRLNHDGFVLKAKVSSDGQWIASTGFDHTLRVWDAVSGSQMLQGVVSDIGSALAFAPDGHSVVVGDRSGNLTIWDLSSLEARIGYLQFPEYVHEVHLSANDQQLFANSDDRIIWSIGMENILQRHDPLRTEALLTASGLTYNLAVSPDASWVAAAQSQENKAILHNLKEKTTFLFEHAAVVTGVAFSPDGSLLAVSDKSGKVILWEVQSRLKKYELQAASAVLALAFSPDGTQLVGGLDGRANTIVWDLATQAKIVELPQVGDVISVIFSADGEWIATGDNLGVINLWNARELAAAKPFLSYQLNDDVLNLLFSPDRRWLVVGSSDSYAHILDTTLGTEVARLPHVGSVTGLAFTPDGKQLYTVSGKTIQIWDVAKFSLIPTDQLVQTACSRLITNLRLTTWQTLFGGEPYRLICPNLPQGQD
jgi:WD40 repeat protein